MSPVSLRTLQIARPISSNRKPVASLPRLTGAGSMLCEDSSTMASALIGHTGTVGGSLLDATSFTDLYNSANVAALAGRGYDLMVCSGAPASKWKANQDPAADLANLQALMTALNEVSVEQFILISTVDVFARPVQVDEASPVRSMDVDPYGRHRRLLEEFVQARFSGAMIVRLPGLFGKRLKKNFIYDLLHGNALHL